MTLFERFVPRRTVATVATVGTVAEDTLPSSQRVPDSRSQSEREFAATAATAATEQFSVATVPSGALPNSEGTDNWTDEHEERAAIVEYAASVPREWAEGFARLDPGRPPDDVPPRRWLSITVAISEGF
jgi:hypothetical protein